MSLVPVARPDGKKIRALIAERGYSGITEFTRTRLAPHRHPQSLWNICGYEPPTGIAFLREIARALGVKVSDISDWDGDDDDIKSRTETKIPA